MVSFVGAGTINTTPNTGRLTIALKPVGQRDRLDVVLTRLKAAIAPIPGITAFFQPVQDIQIGTRVSRTQYQYTLMDTDAAELAAWAPRLRAKLASLPELRDVASDQQDDGFRTLIDVDRDAGHAPRRVDAGDTGYPVRQLRSAPDLHHFRPGQPVSRRA